MKKRIFTVVCTCMAALMLGACGSRVTNNAESTALAQPEAKREAYDTSEENKNEENDELTLEQKVGQLFIIRPDALKLSLSAAEIDDPNIEGVTEVSEEIAEVIRKYHIGGVCQFGKNILNPEQITKFNDDLQSASDIPMFIAVDEEGGIVARLANNKSFKLPKYKSAAAVGASGDSADAEAMGQTIGTYLKEYGFNMDFAPDADVNTNPSNPVIGNRAFSSDADIAAKMVSAVAQGLRENKILPTLKHFPGHGDTAEDSHSSLAVTYKTLEELKECEFLPFMSDNGLHSVMVGHIAAPNVTGNNMPASLSPELINMIPDKENTLIVTDSLSMQAITDAYSSGEAAVSAFEAGCDILLMPTDFTGAYEAVINAVKNGRISRERLDESVDKIMKYKQLFAY